MSNHFHPAPPVVLVIAGFDPTCGAGIAADLKTIAAHNGYAVAAVSALRGQNPEALQTLSSRLDRDASSIKPGPSSLSICPHL